MDLTVAIVGAIAAVVGALLAGSFTLAGVWLAGHLQTRLQREQRKYEQRTRFHDLRVKTYARFLDAAAEYARGGDAGVNALTEAMCIINFLASPKVRRHARGTFAAAKAARVGEGETQDLHEAFASAGGLFTVAACEELGMFEDAAESHEKADFLR